MYVGRYYSPEIYMVCATHKYSTWQFITGAASLHQALGYFAGYCDAQLEHGVA
jgi:hypothetical protein